MNKTEQDIAADFEAYGCLKMFDFSISPGWNDIVYNIFKCLSYKKPEAVWKDSSNNTTLLHCLEVVQIKQKFGGLRFYYDYKDDAVGLTEYDKGLISGIVDMAECIACTTCEYCGENGELRNIKGYYTTCCDKHKTMLQNGEYP